MSKKIKKTAARRIKLVALNSRFTHSCMALFYLRNELEKHFPTAQSEICQHTINDNYYETFLRICEDDPFAVFLSAAIWNSDRIEQLARDFHDCLPECHLVIGGPQAGVLRERLADEICTVVIGEIEAVPEQFYRDLESGELQPRYVGSFLRQQKRSLDYPYRDSDFQGPLLNRHIYYETSRGCPYSCTYCLSAAEKGLFHKDLEQVKSELGHILKFKPKVLRFVDRTFNDLPERALAIWKFLAGRQTETLFHFEIAPERFSEEMFAFLETVEPGRFQFEIGIQSTNGPTLDAIRRRIDADQVHATIERLVGIGNIHLHVDLILGLPYETPETFFKSFADVYSMGAHYIQMGLLKILPDTPICHGVHEYGYSHCTEAPYSVFANMWMARPTMAELYWFCECVEKFLNNRFFVSLWKYLRESREDISVFFRQLLEICRQHDFFQRAATQELMCRMLVKLFADRGDRRLATDLLRHDWLRCGHRFLPDCLAMAEGEEQTVETRDLLYRRLPDSIEGVYQLKGRNRFFKRIFCLRISDTALQSLGYGTNEGRRLCFSTEREETLHRHNRVFRLERYCMPNDGD